MVGAAVVVVGAAGFVVGSGVVVVGAAVVVVGSGVDVVGSGVVVVGTAVVVVGAAVVVVVEVVTTQHSVLQGPAPPLHRVEFGAGVPEVHTNPSQVCKQQNALVQVPGGPHSTACLAGSGISSVPMQVKSAQVPVNARPGHCSCVLSTMSALSPLDAYTQSMISQYVAVQVSHTSAHTHIYIYIYKLYIYTQRRER